MSVWVTVSPSHPKSCLLLTGRPTRAFCRFAPSRGQQTGPGSGQRRRICGNSHNPSAPPQPLLLPLWGESRALDDTRDAAVPGSNQLRYKTGHVGPSVWALDVTRTCLGPVTSPAWASMSSRAEETVGGGQQSGGPTPCYSAPLQMEREREREREKERERERELCSCKQTRTIGPMASGVRSLQKVPRGLSVTFLPKRQDCWEQQPCSGGRGGSTV